MSDTQLGKFIIKMMPEALGPDGRRIEESFENAGTLDDHPALVAACSKVISRACKTPQVAGGTAPKASETLAVMSIMSATVGSPFRPGGTRGRTPTNTDTARAEPKPMPAGETNPNWDSKCPSKMCHIPHQGACFSDPSNANISHALFTNDKARGRIDARRKVNAARLGVPVVKWKTPTPGAATASPAKSVNSLTMLDVQAPGQGNAVAPALMVMSVNENAQCVSDSDMPALCSGSESEGDERINLFNSISARNARRNEINDPATSSAEQTRLLQEQTVAGVHTAALEGYGYRKRYRGQFSLPKKSKSEFAEPYPPRPTAI